MEQDTVGFIVVEEVEFDEELYKKNLAENDFTAKETYEGKDGKGVDEE